MKKLIEDYIAFQKWALCAEGCDWCCGGGDAWAERLERSRAAINKSWRDILGDVLYAAVGELDDAGDDSEEDDPNDDPRIVAALAAVESAYLERVGG